MSQGALSGNFHHIRTRAIVLLAWGSALRVKEIAALQLAQVLEDPRKAHVRLRSSSYLRADQAKGGLGKKRAGVGAFIITKEARAALRDYLRTAKARDWLQLPPPKEAPLWVTIKSRGAKTGPWHGRLSKRMIEHSFLQLQTRAGIREPYRFHDLRHDALTRFAESCHGNPFRVAQFGRFNDIRTAMRYCHTDFMTLASLAELAASK